MNCASKTICHTTSSQSTYHVQHHRVELQPDSLAYNCPSLLHLSICSKRISKVHQFILTKIWIITINFFFQLLKMFRDQFGAVSVLQLRVLLQKLCYSAKHRLAITLNISPPQRSFARWALIFAINSHSVTCLS